MGMSVLLPSRGFPLSSLASISINIFWEVRAWEYPFICYHAASSASFLAPILINIISTVVSVGTSVFFAITRLPHIPLPRLFPSKCSWETRAWEHFIPGRPSASPASVCRAPLPRHIPFAPLPRISCSCLHATYYIINITFIV